MSHAAGRSEQSVKMAPAAGPDSTKSGGAGLAEDVPKSRDSPRLSTDDDGTVIIVGGTTRGVLRV